MQRKPLLIAIFALSLTLAIAGCGSSDEPGGSNSSDGVGAGNGSQSQTQATKLTQSELVAKGDKLCAALEKKSNSLNNAGSEQDIASALGKMLKEYEATLDQLRELTPPADLSAAYKSWLEGNEEMIEIFEELKKLASEQNNAPASDLNAKMTAQIERLDELAEEIGFKDCTRK